MSKNVKQVINIPEGADILLLEHSLKIVGKESFIERSYYNGIDYSRVGNSLVVQNRGRYTNTKEANAFIGLEFALLTNLIKGVFEGHTKSVIIKGVGFSFKLNTETSLLELKAGFTHPVILKIPEDLSVKLVSAVQVTILGVEKDKVGAFAAKIREARPPEPYKGKGIRYFNEVVSIKPGKTRK